MSCEAQLINVYKYAAPSSLLILLERKLTILSLMFFLSSEFEYTTLAQIPNVWNYLL